ncbi:MAG: permease [Anaerolineales bacterium]|nr:permease [Anaerolineales bacterium]
MDSLIELFTKTTLQVWHTLSANWIFLLASAVIAAALKLYVNQDRVGAFLQRNRKAGVLIATGAAVTTPLCSCGTTAIILGMMAGNMPWAPIIAFMVSSPLTSPQELIFSVGLFGWNFALAFFLASILLGLAGGAFAHILEARGWLANQARFKPITGASGLTAADAIQTKPRVTLNQFLNETYLAGKRLALFFLGFAFIGYLLNNLIPSQWISTLFGAGQIYGVPLAALLGIPFYFNTEASLPLARTLMDAGMSQGAVLAFLITGAGTSIGAIVGALTIARWRVVALVIATLFTGAVLFGYGYNILIGVL